MTGPRCQRRGLSSPQIVAVVALWVGLAAGAAAQGSAATPISIVGHASKADPAAGAAAQGSAATDWVALEALYDATGGPGWALGLDAGSAHACPDLQLSDDAQP